MSLGNQPAFPVKEVPGVNLYYGLSTREHFAALAMQGIVSRTSCMDTYEDIARISVELADALLMELEKRP